MAFLGGLVYYANTIESEIERIERIACYDYEDTSFYVYKVEEMVNGNLVSSGVETYDKDKLPTDTENKRYTILSAVDGDMFHDAYIFQDVHMDAMNNQNQTSNEIEWTDDYIVTLEKNILTVLPRMNIFL